MSKLTDAYTTMSKARNFEAGDTVRVIRLAKTRDLGWQSAWIPSMDGAWNRSFTVANVSHTRGIRLKGLSASFPFFVLGLVEKAPQHTIVIDGKEIELSEESYAALKKSLK